MSDGRPHDNFGFSRLGALALCPGRHHMEELHGRQPESEIAASGSRIHAAATGEEVEDLTGDEAEVAEKIREYVDHHLEGADHRSHEAQLHVFDPEWDDGKTPLTSGYLDHLGLWYRSGRAKLIETKSGFLENLHSLTWQIHGQAAGILDTFPAIKAVDAYGYNPRIRGGVEFTATFARGALPDLKRKILEVRLRGERGPFTLNPSDDACRTCGARAMCGVAYSTTRELVVRGATNGLQTYPAESLGALGRQAKVLQGCIDDVMTEVKRRLLAGESIKGFAIERSRGRRYFADNRVMAAKLIGRLSPGELIDLALIPVSKVEAAYVKKAKETVGTKAAAEKEFETLLGDVIARGKGSEKLVRKDTV